MLFNKRFKTYEALLEYEAVERGRQEGLKEGLKQGRLVLLELVTALVERHGVSPAADVSEKIAAADTAQLSAWIQALAEGGDPAELFTAAPHPAA